MTHSLVTHNSRTWPTDQQPTNDVTTPSITSHYASEAHKTNVQINLIFNNTSEMV